ncbi:FecR family protein [Flavobacterium chungangense]|uniref:Iron dicitrate transport regulator FecR n=1 Tax=Flavobacterium chungangense TaxID=554283 RepID=A0A6V6Z0G8_9FLAO|nr:FecR family protein [Flavobacterium chungangense]CAD0005250.1 iron dicitrate transport regulator FecR [Flavobacterium chungangense]
MDNLNSTILSLIGSYLSKELDQKDFDTLQNWINESPDNELFFIEYVKLYKKSRQLGFQKIIDKNKAWKNIHPKLSNFPHTDLYDSEPGVFKLNFNFLRYAAILLVLLGLGFYFYSSTADTQAVPAVVQSAPIQPGTDKATLVLGNGKIIVLGQGNTYNADGISANGKNVAYKDSDTKIEYNYLTIPRAGQFSLQLADGTKVWLNSESQLKFPNRFINGKSRNVELVYGEAYFEVSPSTAHKGSHFNVKVKGQNVEVLGTQFNIKAYADEANIFTTLVEGKVELSNNKQVVQLHPNQQTVLNKASNTMQTKSVDVYDDIAWKDGVFSFQRKSLKEITLILSRWYDIDVVFKNPGLQNKGFNGLFEKNQGIVEILETFKKLGAISKYTIREKTVVLE